MKNVDNIQHILLKYLQIGVIFCEYWRVVKRLATEKEKTERFKRVAEGRTNKIIDQIRLLGNCSNKSNYEYSEEDIRKIFNAIEAELKETKAKFQSKARNRKFEL